MIALLKLSPVFVMAGLMISGMDALLAAPIATIYAAMVASLVCKFKFNDIVDGAVENVKEMQLVFFILMAAYAMAEAFMATGVGASIINFSLTLGLTARTVAVTGFLVTAVLSVATGTSWGTFAACAPIFLWLNHILGGNILLTTAAIAGGACFGDNIGLISDTTVVSSGIQKVEVIHRIRHQGVWSLICLTITAIIFYGVSIGMGLPTVAGNAGQAINQIPKEVWVSLEKARPSAVELLNQVKTGVPGYMIIPLLIVLVVAIKGLPTLACLGLGIVASLILGLTAGTVESVTQFLELMKTGFSDAGSWVIVMMMWVGAFGGIMGKMDAFAPLSKFVSNISRNVRELMFWNGMLSILGNAALADEMAQIVTVGPIIKSLLEDNVEGSEEDMYTLHLRNATFSDALGVFGSQLIPWHVYIGFYVGIASAVYPLHKFIPLDIIKYNFMAMVAVGSLLLLTLTGLDRFIPLFKLPVEPNVKLKKSIEEKSTEDLSA
ncbi:Na+/H+ antiporter NhaC family protein [Clostridium bowmanii]|uniref:Na+/H+ antiporter NhaC family protein n=1 Tax=Clostridium bowmanii TaxID=132925 RepID=UPI001C0C857E|nr:Na+/H+ antiporter NhaC family protein [Clostridium bowmanii]MBU3192083.1 Na+/H+ antiporter NhaC family protein [Clostridium bowmanii]MCA1076334.1 Na+/H+ antiporter NhaC family protein [Clostridium bowmanii]